MQLIKRFIQEEDGVTAIEYALIAALIAVAIVTTVTALGGQLNVVFGLIKDAITPAA